MRVALFGGTFDPIHRGHLVIAAAAADAYALDRILFAPVGNQPLKSEPPIASYADRLAMARLACAPTAQNPDPRFSVSRLDAPHSDGTPNYSIDLIAALLLESPSATLFVLTGADSFLDLRRWRSPDRLLDLAEWIVVSRPDFPLNEAQLAPLALTPVQRSRVHLLTTVHEDLSASDLRPRLRVGDPCTGLLCPAVADYIRSHNLYR
jgi:nicotinate-nucleotide adenylyltransferase